MEMNKLINMTLQQPRNNVGTNWSSNEPNFTSNLIIPPQEPPSPMDLLDKMELEIKTLLIAMYWVIAPVLVFLGLVGNFLTLIVISKLTSMETKPGVKQFIAAHIYIKWMALSDFLDCIFFIPFPIMYYLGRWLDFPYVYRHGFIFLECYIQFTFLNAFYKISSLIIVMISVDRFIAICYALKYKTFCTPFRVYMAIAFSYFLGIILATGESLKYSPRTKWSAAKNATIWFVEINSTAKAGLVVYIMSWTKEILASIIPMIAICYLNYRIAIAFKGMMKKKKEITVEKSSAAGNTTTTTISKTNEAIKDGNTSAAAKKGQVVSNEDRELTALMMGIVVSYFAANIPMSIHMVLGLLKPVYYSKRQFITYLHITNILSMGHSAINFFLYLYFNKNFRKVLIAMFTKKSSK